MSSLADRLAVLEELDDDWDGNGSPAPSVASIANAVAFVRELGQAEPGPAVGPASDDGVVFEWDLDDGFSIYCYARADGVEVAAFDDNREYVEIKLRPEPAAEMVKIVIEARRTRVPA